MTITGVRDDDYENEYNARFREIADLLKNPKVEHIRVQPPDWNLIGGSCRCGNAWPCPETFTKG